MEKMMKTLYFPFGLMTWTPLGGDLFLVRFTQTKEPKPTELEPAARLFKAVYSVPQRAAAPRKAKRRQKWRGKRPALLKRIGELRKAGNTWGNIGKALEVSPGYAMKLAKRGK